MWLLGYAGHPAAPKPAADRWICHVRLESPHLPGIHAIREQREQVRAPSAREFEASHLHPEHGPKTPLGCATSVPRPPFADRLV